LQLSNLFFKFRCGYSHKSPTSSKTNFKRCRK